MTKCPICGGNEWDKGNVEIGDFPQSVWDRFIYYTTKSEKIPAYMARLGGMVCLNCGYVLIFIDKNHLSKKDSKNEEH